MVVCLKFGAYTLPRAGDDTSKISGTSAVRFHGLEQIATIDSEPNQPIGQVGVRHEV